MIKKLIFFFVIIGCLKPNEYTEQVNQAEQVISLQSWDDFIENRQGNIPLMIIAVHGGSLDPDWIKTRTCDEATIVKDSYTKEVALKIESQLKIYGYNPYIVLNDLHRKKLDLNRSLIKSNCNF